MDVHYDIQNLPLFKNAVITIGSFDGVHTGHQQIINQLLTEAKAIDGETVVITFHPHPKTIVNNKEEIKILNTLDEKIFLLKNLGINHVVVVPFTSAFAKQTATEYINNFLIAHFHPHTIIIGHDHKFGEARKGNYNLLKSHATLNNFVVKEIPKHVLQNITISSTKIRAALVSNNIKVANQFLGYDYFFSAKVIDGNKLGRTIGYPTANLFIEDEQKLIPTNGVFIVKISIAHLPNTIYYGMMNIGTRPTIGGAKKVIEVNIFNFTEDIYNKKITIFFKHKLRAEKKFANLEELKKQLEKDKETSLKYLLQNFTNCDT